MVGNACWIRLRRWIVYARPPAHGDRRGERSGDCGNRAGLGAWVENTRGPVDGTNAFCGNGDRGGMGSD